VAHGYCGEHISSIAPRPPATRALATHNLVRGLILRQKPPADLSQQNTPLSIIANILATAILREIARENGQSSDIQLDFPRDGSMCASTAQQAGEKAP